MNDPINLACSHTGAKVIIDRRLFKFSNSCLSLPPIPKAHQTGYPTHRLDLFEAANLSHTFPTTAAARYQIIKIQSTITVPTLCHQGAPQPPATRAYYLAPIGNFEPSHTQEPVPDSVPQLYHGGASACAVPCLGFTWVAWVRPYPARALDQALTFQDRHKMSLVLVISVPPFSRHPLFFFVL